MEIFLNSLLVELYNSTKKRQHYFDILYTLLVCQNNVAAFSCCGKYFCRHCCNLVKKSKKCSFDLSRTTRKKRVLSQLESVLTYEKACARTLSVATVLDQEKQYVS